MTEHQTAIKIVSEETPVAATKSKRWPLFLGLAVAVVALGGGYEAYDILYASKHAVTDNAYVGADTASINPLIAASVVEVPVSDTQTVKAGDVLVRLDDTDARLQFQNAEAQYQSAVRRVGGYFANDRALAAQIDARAADEARAVAMLASAEAEGQKARVDLDRRRALAGKGSVSGDELTSVDTAYKSALANLEAAKAARSLAIAGREAAIAQREANASLIAGVTVETHPEVVAARAARDEAKVNLDRAVIRAPIDGVVSRRQIQVGQRVQPGMTLMVVVPLDQVYVDANFKEVQLAKVREGQSVSLTSDLHGGDFVYKGKVVGLSGGTGSAFSLIPAQNATGNWIKVVQRLPVRIALDPAQLKAHPLQVGLSMTADVLTID